MASTHKKIITELLERIDGVSTKDALALLAESFPGKVTFSSSFSFEDQLISHEILHNNLPISIFTLDTGRLFSETYSVWVSTNERYNTHIIPYYPQAEALGKFVTEK